MTTLLAAPASALPVALAARAERIRTALARRDEQDAAIAHELRAAKAELESEQHWLAWCAKEFGWKRSQAFKRLSPVAMQKDRQATAARRRSVSTVETASESKAKRRVRDVALAIVTAGHRALAMKHHPDKSSGSVAKMTDVNLARAALMRCIEDW